MKNDIIEELLSDLISKCEAKMTEPFKKKKEAVEVVEEEPEADVLEVSVEKPEDDDMDEETMQKLLEMYRKSK